jgi:biofilm PGA synthesis N-glycosyltransferase PgaC
MNIHLESSWWLLPPLMAFLGVSITFWCMVGLCRFCWEHLLAPRSRAASIRVEDVAVVIPAHNEEVALPKCLAALTAIVPASQIHVASDGSKDRTVAIARAAGCKVLDIQPNGGKAKALATAIEAFELCDKYKAVLIQDADSEIDPDYLYYALPLFEDPRNVVVAGHVLSRWRKQFWPSLDMLYAAYRTRLYRLLQYAFQYGQTWRFTNVSYIAPGFASMYRASVLKHIDITAPGLVIEDFNMTFEVQRKGLARILAGHVLAFARRASDRTFDGVGSRPGAPGAGRPAFRNRPSHACIFHNRAECRDDLAPATRGTFPCRRLRTYSRGQPYRATPEHVGLWTAFSIGAPA